MKRNISICLRSLVCIVMLLAMALTSLVIQVGAYDTEPYYITNAYGQDAATELVVQWHNDTSVRSQELQITLAEDTEFKNAKSHRAASRLFSNVNAADTQGEYTHRGEITPRNVWYVEVDGLLPDTQYIYRVGARGAWSETYHHLTAGEDGDFSFTVFSDPQSAEHGAMINTLSVAKKYDQNTRFFLNLGDVCNEIATYPKEIISYTEAAAQFNTHTPIMTTQGNHDTYTTEGNNIYRYGNAFIFNHYITFPKNGCDENPDHGQSYYFYYNNVLFIMLNTLVTDGQQSVQAQWLRSILEYDRRHMLSRYIVVGMHTGPFGNRSVDPGKEPVIRRAYCQIFSDYDVDVVYSGHDHTYARTNPIKIDSDTSISGMDYSAVEDGTYYSIVGATGPKFYESTASGPDAYFLGYRAKTYEDVEDGIFLNIKVTGEGMHVATVRVTATGEVDQILEEYDIPAKRTLDKKVIADGNHATFDLGGGKNAYQNVEKIEIKNALGKVIATPESANDMTVSDLRASSDYQMQVVLTYEDGEKITHDFSFRTGCYLSADVATLSLTAPVDAKRYRLYKNGDLLCEDVVGETTLSVGELAAGSYLFRIELYDEDEELIGVDHAFIKA